MTAAIDERAAARLGITAGQLYTYAIGVVVAASSVLFGVLPSVRPSGDRSASAAPVTVPASAVPSWAPTTDPVAVALAPPLPGVVTAATSTTPSDSISLPPVGMSPLARAVIDGGWASGTPLGLDDGSVPADGLPVGADAGRDDKRSFVHLRGQGPVLHLDVTGTQVLDDQATIAGCPIGGPWTARLGETLAQSPTFDAAHCAPAVRRPDGSWDIDLSHLPDPAVPNGIALVPGAGAGTFRVTFAMKG